MAFDFSMIDGKKDVVVHCPDEDVAKSFLDAFNMRYPRHRFLPAPDSCWSVYNEDTCYFPNFGTSFRNMQFGDIRYAAREGYNVISVYELCKEHELPISLSEVDIKSLFGME